MVLGAERDHASGIVMLALTPGRIEVMPVQIRIAAAIDRTAEANFSPLTGINIPPWSVLLLALHRLRPLDGLGISGRRLGNYLLRFVRSADASRVPALREPARPSPVIWPRELGQRSGRLAAASLSGFVRGLRSSRVGTIGLERVLSNPHFRQD